jgi:hypothetical protein
MKPFSVALFLCVPILLPELVASNPQKSGDTDPANGVILREAPRKALRPLENLAPTDDLYAGRTIPSATTGFGVRNPARFR